MGELTPVTADQMYLAKMAGMDVEIPQPVTVDQMFMQKIIENGGSGGASSWNDLKDKPFYEETVEEVVLPKSEIDFTKSTTVTAHEGENGHIATPFVLGEHYTVVYDEMEYDCTFYAVGGGGYIGNSYLFDTNSINNGMPFAALCGVDAADNPFVRYKVEAKGEHTFEIRQEVKTIHTIEPKYLPCDLLIHVDARPNGDVFTANDVEVKKGSAAEVMAILDTGGIPTVKVEYNSDYISGEWVNRHRAVFDCHVEDYNGTLFLYHDVPFGGGAYKFVMHPDEAGVLECWFNALLLGSGGQMF